MPKTRGVGTGGPVPHSRKVGGPAGPLMTRDYHGLLPFTTSEYQWVHGPGPLERKKTFFFLAAVIFFTTKLETRHKKNRAPPKKAMQ